jgi:hypothetical protein
LGNVIFCTGGVRVCIFVDGVLPDTPVQPQQSLENELASAFPAVLLQMLVIAVPF